MSNSNDIPAFPCPLPHSDTGMGLRDYFAGQALIGILGARSGFLVDVGVANAGEWAYRAADAMLAAREPAPQEDYMPELVAITPDDLAALSVRSRKILQRRGVTFFDEIPDHPQAMWDSCGEFAGNDIMQWKQKRLAARKKVSA